MVSEQDRPGLVLALLGLSLLGRLAPVQALVCDRPVMGATVTLIDADIQKEDFPEGISVTFQCSIGHTSNGGSGATVCKAGTWTNLTLTCERFNCPGLEIDNGHVEGGTYFGDKATFSCNSGYILGKPIELTCGAGGWIGRPPTCSVVKCGAPPLVDNADPPSPSRDFYDYASVVKYKCRSNVYTMNGTGTLKCSNDGTFTPNPPTCIVVVCKTPIIPDGSQKSGARPPYGYRNNVEWQCNPGFEMIGSGSMTCQLNSTWSSMPVCKGPVDPPKPGPVDPPKPGPVDPPKPDPPVDPSPGGAQKWLQSWWFILLMIVIVVVLISSICFVFRKKRWFRPHDDDVGDNKML